jgi:hypothetical protein
MLDILSYLRALPSLLYLDIAVLLLTASASRASKRDYK